MDINSLFHFSVIDVIDVFLVALLLYYVYKLIKGTVAINIFIGFLMIYFIWKLTLFLNMQLLSDIFGGFMQVGIIAIIVIFQPEIRKFLLLIGSTNFNRKGGYFQQFNFLKTSSINPTNVEVVLAACSKLGQIQFGALIVLERNNNLDFLRNTGDDMNINVSQPIIESIFFKNSPLHDGAIIIKHNIIKATRVILPLNHDKNIPKRFGLRHRAAIGVTERTDALAIVVSEETGQISYFKDGEFVVFNNLEELTKIITADLA